MASLALLVSGVGYLALDGDLADAAFLSLPLLLIWAAGTGVALGRRQAEDGSGRKVAGLASRCRPGPRDEDPRDPELHRCHHDEVARGRRSRQAPPAQHRARQGMDRAAADLRLRDRACRGLRRRNANRLPAEPQPRNRRSARRAADRRSGRAEGGRVTRLTTSVRIRCPLDEVFAFVSEPLNFPRWNSAVRAVRKTRGRDGEVGSTYTMERELPRGSVQNELEIFARRRPTEFGIRTTSEPTPVQLLLRVFHGEWPGAR